MTAAARARTHDDDAGRLTWTLVALLALVAALLTGPATGTATAEDDAGSGPDQVVDITFPLSGENYYVDTYDACRSGCSRVHRATDLMADKMVPIHAVVDGEICTITGLDGDPPWYGYMIRLCGDDGLRYSYVHINNDTPGTDDGAGGTAYAYAEGMEKGVRVARGQHIAWVGDSGNAEETGAHLHFEIFDESAENTSWQGRINPYQSLRAAEERGDIPEEPGSQPGPPAPQPAPQPVSEGDDGSRRTVQRLAGEDRVSTAISLSRAAWRGQSRSVVIVPSGSHAEALVAAPLAGLMDSPVLLADPGGLSAATMQEIERLNPLNAYIIGTTAQLSGQVEADLATAGVEFHARLSGADPFALSATVADEVATTGDGTLDRVILALGDAPEASRAWPDALSASALAAHTGTPILLTEPDRLPGEVADLLAAHQPSTVTVVGGTAAIRETVMDEVERLSGPQADVERIAGSTRYQTSVLLAQAAVDEGLRAVDVLVATGLNYPDALAAGPAAAHMGVPIVLVDGLNPDGAPESRTWLGDHVDGIRVVGGTAVVTDEVVQRLIR